MPQGNWREFENLETNTNVESYSNSPLKGDRTVRVQRTRVGKSGKMVTVIKGLGLNHEDSKILLKKLKTRCGSGGTFKEGIIELQGDQIQQAIELLKKEGFQPKQSGG
ncbi:MULTISPECIES: translation initiation factor [unclassified Prochlorococcus]|uniref:translation initiation factor n=1 Tax=unclassified Prochlorococcus TaxID=2627481 RepID=UPI000533845C|nr:MULTISPECIES: translation initiation factor [unclassified Prochlorococcus]KGG16773.1 Translation initiation factor SUI1-related protein [Prochlorococcus sp. MIT 0602]KGG18253.1 Translation initiation factor SUI1-related protein [Prochlorococcus sp. MIT 0603]